MQNYHHYLSNKICFIILSTALYTTQCRARTEPLIAINNKNQSEKSTNATPPLRKRFISYTVVRRPPQNKAHSLQFLATDKENGKVLGGYSYLVILSNNNEYVGVTDMEGRTEVFEDDKPFSGTIKVPYYDGSSIEPKLEDNIIAPDDQCFF